MSIWANEFSFAEASMTDAPLYLAAKRYDEPVLAQSGFGIDDISVADLVRGPATREVLDQEVPGLTALAQAPQIAPTLTNVTLREMTTFSFSASMFKPGTLERIDARLRALPTNAWPGL